MSGMMACRHGYYRGVESCALCETEEERDEARGVARALLQYAETNCGCCLGYDPGSKVREIRDRHSWLKDEDEPPQGR